MLQARTSHGYQQLQYHASDQDDQISMPRGPHYLSYECLPSVLIKAVVPRIEKPHMAEEI